MKLNIKQETLLFDFFLFQVVLGGYVSDEKIFSLLASIFCMDKEDLEDLQNLTTSSSINEVKNEDDYKRYLRVVQFKKLNGVEEIDEDECSLFSIKGDAITSAVNGRVFAEKGSSEYSIKNNLIKTAQCGSIISLRLLGILYCSGYLFNENKEFGLKMLSKAASWGDFVSALGYLYFSDKNREKMFSTIRAIVSNEVHEEYLDSLKNKYKLEGTSLDENMVLLKKCFYLGKAKSDLFSPFVNRIIVSEILSLKDKEKILFSDNKELISMTCDLPLKLHKSPFEFDKEVLENMHLSRPKEQEEINRYLRNASRCSLTNYLPVSISSTSKYVSQAYVSSISKAFNKSNVVIIECDDLTEEDFAPNMNNVFVRKVNEDKTNVFIFNLTNDVNSGVLARLRAFLKTTNRKNFSIHNPAISLDLSTVLPIVITSKTNESKISDVTQVIKTNNVSEDEKRSIVKEIIDRKAEEYECDKINISDKAFEKLVALSLESIDKALENMFTELNDSKIDIDEEEMKKIIKSMKVSDTNYGFGGNLYDHR